MEDAAFAVGLGLGSIILASVCWVYVQARTFGAGGSFLSICGLILVGMSAWKTIDVSVTAKGFTAKLDQIEKNVADVQVQNNQTNKTLNDLSEKVDVIDKHLSITSSKNLTSEEEARIGKTFEDYLRYLAALGYKGGTPAVHVIIGHSDSTTSYYNPTDSTLFVNEKDTKNPDYVISILAEYTHDVLYKDKNSKDLNDMSTFIDLEFSLHNYLPRSFMNSSAVDMGDQGSWDLQTTVKFGHTGACRNLACERDQPWAGAYWDLREKLGRDTFDKILFASWEKLQPEQVARGDGAPFVKELMQSDGGRHAEIIRNIFKERGLDVPLERGPPSR